MRKLITILLIFIPTIIYSQEAWIKYEIGKVDSVYLYLKVKKYACVADDKWIGFEIENRSKDSIISENRCSFGIQRNAYGWTGNLAQGINSYPFLKTDGSSSIITPGQHKLYNGISEEASCMLGIPSIDSDTTEVFCTLSFSLPLSNGKKLNVDHYKFSFNWYYPSCEQFKYLGMRLKESLFLEEINSYYYYMLMGNRKITDSIPVQYYLKALSETKKDFNFRGDILQYLDELYYKDTTVVNYFAQKLDSNSYSIHEDLIYLTNISQNLLDEILNYFTEHINSPRERYYTLLWLDSVKDLVSQDVIDEYTNVILTQSLLTKDLASFSSKELKNWLNLVNSLGLVGDTTLIKYLLPLLSDKSVITRTHWNIIIRESSRGRVVFPKYRICDVVLEAIFKLKGINSSIYYSHIFESSKGKRIYYASSLKEHLKQKQAVSHIRDELIENLLK